MKSGAGILFWRRTAQGHAEVLLGLRALTIRHAPGVWSYPGGSLHPGEGPLAGALRESLEEAGVDFRADLYALPRFAFEGEPLRVLSLSPFLDYSYTTFACEALDVPQDWPRWNWEHERFEWFSLRDLPRPLHSQARLAIGSLRRLL
jgi:8-oxo-dGTP pyrophosphatase MutT (NUDIX family)